jgi:beta-mannosidase
VKHRDSFSLEGHDWRLGYRKVYDGSASGTIAEVEKLTEWVESTVPGNVRADLISAGRLPDLFLANNNDRATWVNDCVWWYEKKFAAPPGNFKRYFLDFHGIDYLSHIYLNGRKFGQNEGMFTRQQYDVSSSIRDENTLNVRLMGSSFLPKPRLSPWERILSRVGKPLQGGLEVFPDRIETLKCQMGFGWDFAPDMPTIGIWDEVHLIGCGNVFVAHMHVITSVLRDLGQAKLKVRLYVNSLAATPIKLVMRLRPVNFPGDSHHFTFNAFVKKGAEMIERNIMLENPPLWNPWDRGKPNLFELTASVYEGDALSDQVSELVGIRDVSMARNPKTPRGNLDWTFTVNGEREFIRGANWVPADALMGRLREEDYEQLIGMAKAIHINMLRVWGGGLREKRHFYEICSREGILVWQEFPFACLFLGHLPRNESFLRTAAKEVTSIVKAIVNYPCVAAYCGGNELSPGRNTQVLARVAKTVRAIDTTRPFIPASPGRGDSHNWSVWHGFANIREYQNDRSQFASEFGLQAAPSVESLKKFLEGPSFWPPGEQWEYHRAELKKLERYAGSFDGFLRPENFVETSQRVQAFALQTAIEHYRRRKYECSGVIFWQLNDPWPAISWSIIDYYRRPKMAYHALKDIYKPILVSLKYDLRRHEFGEIIPIEAWVVNDLAQPLEDCRLDVFIEDNGERLMNLHFDIGAVPRDSSQKCFEFSLKMPNRPHCVLHAVLYSADKAIAKNAYDMNMWDPGDATWWNHFYDRMGKWVLK